MFCMNHLYLPVLYIYTNIDLFSIFSMLKSILIVDFYLMMLYLICS